MINSLELEKNMLKENEMYLKTILKKDNKAKLILNIFFYVFYALAFLGFLGVIIEVYKEPSFLLKGLLIIALLSFLVSISMIMRMYYLQTFNIIERTNYINELKFLKKEVEELKTINENLIFEIERLRRELNKGSSN
jgi:hypothetical protein